MRLFLVLVSIMIMVIAFWLTIDTDLPLYLSPAAPEMAFEDKIVWITGASSGIGASLAGDLARAGAQVIISARRGDKLDAVVRSINDFGKNKHLVVSYTVDVTSHDKQKEVLDTILSKFRKIDILVLNAGRSQRSLAVNTPIEDTKSLFDLNVIGVIDLTRHILPHMLKNGDGHIVAISSVTGKFGVPISSSYSASKFAMQGYFDSLRGEVDYQGVRVTVICPGPVESEIGENAVRDENLPQMKEGNKMPTARCSELIARAIYYNFGEVWIAQQPFLLFTYVLTYMPWIARQAISKLIGPGRVKALETGGEVFDIQTNLGMKK